MHKEVSRFLRKSKCTGLTCLSFPCLLLFAKGEFLEVIDGCKRVLKKRKHQLFFNLLSIAYQKNGKIEKSIDVMREALSLNPDHPNFLNNIGI